MNQSSTNRTPVNRLYDLGAWGLVLLLIGATPLLVSLFRTPPEFGPVKDPSILIMFLSFLVLIGISSLAIYGGMAVGRVKSIANPKGLTLTGANVINMLTKVTAGLLIISGFVKLQDITGFGYKLDDYWYAFEGSWGIFPAQFMSKLSVPMAGFVSVFEVVLAFALLTGYRMRITATLLVLMMLFFTFLTGYAVITDSVKDCGCFGDALTLTPHQTFYKDIFLVIAVLPLWLLRKRIHSYYRAPWPMISVVGSALVFGFISWYCFQHLPFLDFRGPYQAGQDLEYNSTTIDPHEEQLIAHDFTDFAADCGGRSFDGPALYVILYNVDSKPWEHVEAAAKLEKTLRVEAPGIQMHGGSNTGGQTRKDMKKLFSSSFCLSIQDEKALKTIVRSSPGFMFLRDGVVVKKWHINDIPTVKELRELAGPAADQAIAPLPPEPEPVPTPNDSVMAADSSGNDSTATDSSDQGN